MARIVRLEQGKLALGLFLWNLTKDTFGELVLELPEGGHAIIDAIEQEENADAREQAASQTDQQTLDQPGPDRYRRGGHFHDGNLIGAIHDLGDINLFQIVRKPVVQNLEPIHLSLDAVELGEALAQIECFG